MLPPTPRLFLLPAPLRLAALLTLAALPTLAAPPPSPTQPLPAAAKPDDTTRANRALVRRYIEEVLAGGHLEKLDQIVSQTFADRSAGLPIATAKLRGPQVVRKEQAENRALFTDVRYAIQSLVADGDRVAAHYLVQARRKADGQPGAGQAIAITGMAFYRIANGRIEEAWVLNDKHELFRQLGYATTAPKAASATTEPPREPAPSAPPPR